MFIKEVVQRLFPDELETEDGSDDADLARRAIEQLGKVSDDELTDPKVHARACGPRFQILGAISLESRERSIANSRKLERVEKLARRMERRILLTIMVCTATIGTLAILSFALGPDRTAVLVERLVIHFMDKLI